MQTHFALSTDTIYLRDREVAGSNPVGPILIFFTMINTRRLKRKVKRNKRIIWTTALLAIAALTGVILLASSNNEEPQTPQQTEDYHEITEVDLFSLQERWDSRHVTVKGVRLNDPFESVIKTIGFPDKQAVHPPNIINIEYSTQLGLNGTGLILHFENNVLKRITFREAFNPYLVGKTKIQYSKAQIYGLFGVPDDVKFVPVRQESALVFRDYVYAAKGLEIFIRKNQQFAFSLFI